MHFHHFFSTNLLCISSVLFWFVVLATGDVDTIEKNVNLNDHLTRKLREARVTIVKEYTKVEDDSDPVITVSYDVEWEKIGSEVLNFSESRLVVRILDKMFILEGNRTLSVNVKSVSNETSYVALLDQPAFLRQGRSVKLAKSIVWKSRLYLLVCEEDECNLYIGENDSRLEHEQSLNHRGMFDATFFTRDNRLYLLVTHRKTDQYLGSSTIYHWTGSYMDIIQPIETVGDVLVTAFNYGRATIMVFGQPASEFGLEIYEYYNNRIERISYLPTNGPISVIHYHHDGFDFLLIINKQEASSVYWWDGAGREFIHWFDLLDIVSPSKVNVAQLDGDTFLFVSYESSVRLYKVSRPKYTRLDILDFKTTGERVIDMEVKIDENAKLLTLIVVTFDPSVNQYRIEPWKIYIKKNHKINADVQTAVDTTAQCLSEVFVKLNDRMIAMENLTQNIWPQLLSSEADNTVTESFVLQKLILGSSTLQNAIKIGSIEIDSSAIDAELLLPKEMEEALTATSTLVSTVLNESRQMLKIHGAHTLTGNVIVEGDTKFVNVRTNSIRTSNFNGHEMKLQNFADAAITAKKNQIFANSTLRGKNITVHHLTIDQLCGIPYKYWLRVENAAPDNIFNSHNLTDVTMKNDTVFVESKRGVTTTSLRELSSTSLDGLNIKDFLNQLFIRGERQNIKGNIFQEMPGENTIRIRSLAAEKLNGIPAKSLLTINTDQNITSHVYFPGKMLLKSVVTKKINGIDIADFAMVSKNNYFRGDLTVAKMRVSNRLVIENPKKFSLDPPVQIYNSVRVVGNARVKNIEFQSGAKSSFPALLSNIKDRYWTKSTRQTIKNSVIFDKGLKVDELRVNLLNDLDPDKDILTTNVREISAGFDSLRFMNFTVKHFVREKVASENLSSIIPPDGLYEDAPDSLTINEEIRVERLSVARLYIENFNGIPVDEIMSGRNGNSEAYVYPESNAIQKFETLTVNDRLEMENLQLTFVHGTDGLEKDGELKGKRIDNRFPRINDNYTIHSLKSDKLFLGDLVIDNIAGINIRDFISQRNHCFSGEINEKPNSDSQFCSRLIIEGDALIKKNLNVSTINEKTPMSYFDELATEVFHVNSNHTFVVNNLTVHENVTLNLFRGVRFEALYKNTLSKSRAQHLGYSKMSFFQIFVTDLNTEKINNRSMNDLIYIDSREIMFDGDVTFTNLKISSLDPGSMPEIRTEYLNGYSTLNNEMVEKLGTVSARVINSLKVWGNVFWQESVDEGSENLSKFEAISRYSLLRNKTAPIVIRTNGTESAIIKSSNGVFVSRMTSKVKGTLRDQSGDTEIDIENILQDCVLDGPSSLQPEKGEIRIGGKKTFRKDLKVDQLMVLGEINIKNLNSWSIKDLNSSIVLVNLSRDDNMFSTINASMIFRKGIKVKNLVILDSKKDLKVASSSLLVHGSSLDGIFTVTGLKGYDEFLPHSTYLEHLVVLDNAHVKYLDSVDLDDFLRNRVSLDSNSQTPIVVHGNIQFNGLIKVSENAWADLVNGIAPADLVFNDTLEKQIISGEKKLVSGDLVIEGETSAPVVAGINLTDAYNNAVLNGDPVEIFGDIIFESDVEKSSTNIGLEKSTDIILGTKDGFPGGFVNQVSLKNFSLEHTTMWENFIFQLEETKSELEARIARVSEIHLPEIFYYLEEENNLVISEAANVERVRVTKLKESSILSFYTNDVGSACGLANECFCRRQYVAEISNGGDDCRTWKVHGPHRIYHFYEPNKAFAIKVATTTVSSNQGCTLFNRTTSSSYEPTVSEFTSISWMGNDRDPLDPQIIKNDLKISGYLSDAAVFFENGLIYIVLAIYYDPIISTHETNSFVYVLDVESNTLELAKQIPTSYAVGVEVFEIPHKGHHIFFSSYADGKSTRSVLYRLERHSTEFRLLRRFLSGGNRHVKSVTRSKEQFLFLDDVVTKSINVYRYDPELDDYQHHQSIFHDSMAPITSIETFSTGDFRTSQAYVIVTTERDQFFVYKCTFMSKFEAIGRKKVDGIVSMVPFDVADRRYVFVGTDANSTVLRIVEQGIRINRRNGRK